MAERGSENDLIVQAVQGDRDALGALLWMHYDRLAASVRRRLPTDLQGLIDPEDVIQEVHVEAFQTIRKFSAQGENAFVRWLATITEYRLQDAIKAQRRLKRGGGRKRVAAPSNSASSGAVAWLDALARWDHTPSASASRRELEQAIRVAVAGLKDDCREALRLRDLEGLPVADIAARMNRTERAVHMLCWRGRKQLREALGRASRFLDTT